MHEMSFYAHRPRKWAAILPKATRRTQIATPPSECPLCRSTKVLQTTNASGDDSFICPHCDHIWSAEPPPAPRVLVVDDEPSIRGLATRVLRSAGYDVVTASDGLDGLQIF
jgi:PleD family two-component response regulator